MEEILILFAAGIAESHLGTPDQLQPLVLKRDEFKLKQMWRRAPRIRRAPVEMEKTERAWSLKPRKEAERDVTSSCSRG